jgi:glutamine---fructose-6-phosphate transaminase (isomerizing)
VASPPRGVGLTAMCQLIGYAGREEARPRLLAGLARADRGNADVAGVCMLADGGLELFRAVGHVETLRLRVRGHGARATAGIAHTHGRGCEHPLVAGEIAIAFNGFLASCRPVLTDEELVAQLVAEAYTGDLGAAVRDAYTQLDGRFAFLAVHGSEPETVAAAHRESPLLAGLGDGETYLASSPAALPTRDVVAIDEVVTVSAAGLQVVV